MHSIYSQLIDLQFSNFVRVGVKHLVVTKHNLPVTKSRGREITMIGLKYIDPKILRK